MEAEERNRLLERSNALRQGLKTWERDFAAANAGRKAGRDDIKQNPSIAQKYKDYTKIRDVLSGKAVSQEPCSPQRLKSQKRKHEAAQMHTPSKRVRILRAPCKVVEHPADIDPYDSPSAIRNLFTPVKNRIIGPTPQKDGQVLGLFDLLEDDDSPSKSMDTNSAGNLKETPRKTTSNLEVPLTGRYSRTPASSGKRFMLDSFATPLKGRHHNEQHQKTPSSVSKLHFSTPSFLRRDSHRTVMPSIGETEATLDLSPQMVRLPRKPLVRGLSSILASLRKLEDDEMDDDLDALREMESSTALTCNPIPKKLSFEDAVLVEDSQIQLPLGGFDNEGKYDSEPEDVTRDGPNLKIWKKKGQKRSTRRVNMKPVRSKPSAHPDVPKADEEEDEDVNGRNAADDEDAVPETQRTDTTLFPTSLRNFDSDSGSEYTASEGGTRYRRPDQSKKRKVMGKDGKIRVRARKIVAGAHANFKRLKLRNTGSKGGVAHNSRFRRKK